MDTYPSRGYGRFDFGAWWNRFAHDGLARVFYVAGALATWYVSIVWSSDGFGFMSGHQYAWAGPVIALFAIAVPEYLFTNGDYSGNKTLAAACLFAYAYGIFSNWVGLWVGMGAVSLIAHPADFLVRALLWAPAGILVELLPPNMFNVGIGRRIAGPGFIEKALEILDLKSLRFGRKAVSPRPTPVQAARERRADDEPRQPAARHSLARRRSCPHCHSHNTELMDQGRVRCHACRTVSKLPSVPEAENYADETA
jgi:hypothetical protein